MATKKLAQPKPNCSLIKKKNKQQKITAATNANGIASHTFDEKREQHTLLLLLFSTERADSG